MKTDHQHRAQESHQQPTAEEMDTSSLHQKSQLGFIKKVYGILFAQLGFSALWVITVFLNKGLLRFVRHHSGIGLMFSIITLIGVCTLAFSKKIASTVPYNYAILGVTTISTAWTMSYFTAFFDPEVIAQAALLTGGTVGGLTYYAWTSDGRFNFKKASVYASLAILFV